MTLLQTRGLTAFYGDFQALFGVDITLDRSETVAIIGANGAGKTTLISIVCGLVNASGGEVRVAGHDTVREYRKARALIGLVPQEITRDAFETVINTVSFSRGLYGKPPNPAHIESVLRQLSLWDKRNSRLITLSGGMKRRVLIAKALSHEPRLLFLDEPTAGVDVELRRDMWALVSRLRSSGVTVVLTTHYIEEAEEMADRIGVINRGELILVQRKDVLMRTLGRKQLLVWFEQPLTAVPESIEQTGLTATLIADGHGLQIDYDGHAASQSIGRLLDRIRQLGFPIRDLETRQSSLEEIFVDLVHTGDTTGAGK